MKAYIDIETWKRKEHYLFFNTFDEPFWGLTVNLNCTLSYQYCRAYKISFFNYYLYKTLCAINQVQELKYRIEGDQIACYETVHASVTILRRDNTFGFAFVPFMPDFEAFSESAKRSISKEKGTLGLKTSGHPENLIHCTVLPFNTFMGFSHARKFTNVDSIPKLAFGKIFVQEKQVLLPMSIHVNHALCDGIHVGAFINKLEGYLQLSTER